MILTRDMFDNPEGKHTNTFEVVHDPDYTSEEIITYILGCQDKANNWDALLQQSERYKDLLNDD
jgi:hypothetical protein